MPKAGLFCICLVIFLLMAGMTTVVAGCEEQKKQDKDKSHPGSILQHDQSFNFDIRVLLAGPMNFCRFKSEAGLRLRRLNGEDIEGIGGDVTALRVAFTGDGMRLAQREELVAGSGLEVLAGGKEAVVEVYAEKKRLGQYRGVMRLLRGPKGQGWLINVVDIEQYLQSVVAAELQKGFAWEAFRAQAIVARTYAWYEKETARPEDDWDVYGGQWSQVYSGVERERKVPMAVEAAKKTRGLVCTWESPDGVEIFKTYFSSTCGGCTQSAERMHREDDIPPLAGGIRCLYCQHSPFYWWGPVRLSKQEITRSLRAHYPYFEKLGVIDDLAIVEKSSCGRPVRLRLRDEQGRSKELAAEDFRLAMDIGGLVLKSSFFRPVVEQASIVFTEGRGFGHGMGLCQYGADGMARNGGATAEEIVRFYYPGARVRRAYK